MKNQTDDFSDFEDRLIASGNSAKVGKLNGQRFYVVRASHGEGLTIPFARKKFSALINVRGKFSEDELREIGLKLLKHGLVCAVCIGDAAEKMSSILDDLIDDHNFTFDGFTPYTQTGDGSLADSLEFFTLPTGLTDVSLILTLGGSSDHDAAVDMMNSLFELEEFSPAEDADDDDETLEEGTFRIQPAIAMASMLPV